MEEKFIVYSVLGIIFGIVLFFNGFRTMKRKKLMESLPTSKIRSLAVGFAEIHGTVAADSSRIIKSPISNRDCICAKVLIENTSGFRSTEKLGSNRIMKEVLMGENFFLEDDTGRVLISLQDAELDIPVSFESTSDSYGKFHPDVKAFFKEHNLKLSDGFWSFQTYRCREWIICPNDELYVLGRADSNPHLDKSAEGGIQNIMMQKSKNPNIYFISSQSEKQILEKIDSKIMGQLVGGPLLIGGCLLFIAFNLLNFLGDEIWN